MKTLSKLDELLFAEATEYEFKSELELNKPKSWLKSVSAFANGVGGSIYFGVDDHGHAIGLKNPQEAADAISGRIKQKIEPMVLFDLSPIAMENSIKILRLYVRSGQMTPYYYSSDGNKIAFVRIGNESVQVPPHLLNELILKGKNMFFDTMVTDYTVSDFSFTMLEATYKQRTRNVFDKNIDFNSFGLSANSNKLTNGGLLFADQCPFIHSRVFCTRWNGLEQGSIFDDALDDKEYSGDIISLVNNTKAFIKNNSKVRWRKTSNGRAEYPDYPENAVHEAVVNAIIHRDYSMQATEVHIDMYDDRVEISSPGGMYDGRKIQDLDIMNVPSIRRNPNISDMFHRLRMMERRGSGLKKIKKEYDEEFKPEFYSTGVNFVAILKNLNYKKSDDDVDLNTCEVPINKYKVPISADKVPINIDKYTDLTLNEAKIIKYFDKNSIITNSIAREILGLEATSVKKTLGSLVKKGIVYAIGEKKGRKYMLK